MKPTLLIVILIGILACEKVDKKADKQTHSKTSLSDAQATQENEPKTTTLICPLDESERIYTYLNNLEVPKHLFTLIFKCYGDSLTGKIFGPLPMGEHGLTFFRADLQNIQIASDQNIEFEFTHGNLFETQITLTNYQESLAESNVGINRSHITFKGKNYGDSMVFNCIADFGDCYADEMNFIIKN